MLIPYLCGPITCSHESTTVFSCSSPHHSAKRQLLKWTRQGNQDAPMTNKLPHTRVGWGAGLCGFGKPQAPVPPSCPAQFCQVGKLRLHNPLWLTTPHTISCLNKFQKAHQLLLMNSKSIHPELQRATRCFRQGEKRGVEAKERADSFPLLY